MKILLIGAGEHAQVVADAILAETRAGRMVDLVGYVDDNGALTGTNLLGGRVLGVIADRRRVAHDAVVVAIGDNEIRRRWFTACASESVVFGVVRHPSAVIAPDVAVGEGAMVLAGAVVNTGTVVGRNVILNTSSSVDHHSVIGDHVHIGPGAHLGGRVNVGEGTLIGIGAAIASGIRIGAGVVVGAGTVVIRDVADGQTVAGNPARIISSRKSAASGRGARKTGG